MDRAELERLDREGLVARAQAAGIRRARVLTRPELIDELLRLDADVDPTHLKRTRGFFGIARDLLSRVVERGLHLPDAADRLRAALGNPLPHVPRPEPQAVPTVTLAEIYAAQGHKQRAIETLRRVLEDEPEHGAARALLEKLEAVDYVPPPPPLPPEDEPGDQIGAGLRRAAAANDEDEHEAVTTNPGPRAAKRGAGVSPRTPAERGGVWGEAPSRNEPAVSTPEPVTAEPVATVAHATEDAEPVIADEPEPVTPQVPPAPERSEHACVAIPIDRASSYVWWRLSPDARAQAKDAFFFVRAAIFVPTWDGPTTETRDVACDPAAGELVLGDLPERAVVRVAVGIMTDGAFVPLAHSPALEMTTDRDLIEWTPEGTMAIVLADAPRTTAIGRAVEAAARVAADRKASVSA